MKYLWIFLSGVILFILELYFSSSILIFPGLVIYSFYITVLFGFRVSIIPITVFVVFLTTIYDRSLSIDLLYTLLVISPVSIHWAKHGNHTNYISQSFPVSILSFIYYFLLIIQEIIYIRVITLEMAARFTLLLFLSTLIVFISTPFFILFLDKFAFKISMPLLCKTSKNSEMKNVY